MTSDAFERLKTGLTRLVEESACPYEDVIFILQKEIDWMKTARAQEHGKNPADKALHEMAPATLLRQFGIIPAPWAKANADAIREELRKRLRLWRAKSAKRGR